MAATARVEYDYGINRADAGGNVVAGKRNEYAYGGSVDAARGEMRYGAEQAAAWDGMAPNGRKAIDTTRADAARANVYAGVDEMVRGQQFAQQQATGRAPSAAELRYGQGQEAAALAQAGAAASGPMGAAQAQGMAQAQALGGQFGGARANEVAQGMASYGSGAEALRSTAMQQGNVERDMQKAEIGMQYDARGLTDQMSDFYRRQRSQAAFNQMQAERFASQESRHWDRRVTETNAAAAAAKAAQVAGAVQAGAGAVQMATSMGTQGSGQLAGGLGKAL